MSGVTSNTARWFADRRGIELSTLLSFGIESEGEGVTIPYPEGAVKHRKTLEKVDGKHQMYFDPQPPRGQVPFLPPNFSYTGKTKVVWEGETDTMAAWQAAPEDVKPHLLGMSGANAFGPKGIRKELIEKLFADASRVFFVLDNEDPYEGNEAYESVQRARKQIRETLGRKAKFVTLPQGPQDACEFFQNLDWAAFAELMKQAAQPTTYYPRLDLSKPVPDTPWLVTDLFVQGEATVLAAESGAGKSWLTMALSLAVAGGEDDTFLGRALTKHGRVLYIDEEQPEEVVLQRMRALGYTNEKHQDNLEYLWYPGVDLRNEPHKLLEEAVDRDPVLVVLESLSRVSLGVEENSNTEMSLLWRNGIIPIARETGAAVLVTHHTPVDDAGRPRGAGATKAAADEGMTLMKARDKHGNETGRLLLYPNKPRRELGHVSYTMQGSMEAGEPVLLVPEGQKEVPF